MMIQNGSGLTHEPQVNPNKPNLIKDHSSKTVELFTLIKQTHKTPLGLLYKFNPTCNNADLTELYSLGLVDSVSVKPTYPHVWIWSSVLYPPLPALPG